MLGAILAVIIIVATYREATKPAPDLPYRRPTPRRKRRR